MNAIVEEIKTELLTWEGLSAEPHRFGGVEFRVNHREIGHLHSDRWADLPFPVRVRQDLVASGRASLHHMFPETGWVTFYIRDRSDVPRLIELFRLNYQLVTGRAATLPTR